MFYVFRLERVTVLGNYEPVVLAFVGQYATIEEARAVKEKVGGLILQETV